MSVVAAMGYKAAKDDELFVLRPRSKLYERLAGQVYSEVVNGGAGF